MTAVAEYKDRETGPVSARVIDSTGNETLQSFVNEHAKSEATLFALL